MQATKQHYWRDSTLPFLELRSTFDSVQDYKPHFHPQLSFGALVSGTTHAQLGGHDLVLQEGDLIIIPPYLVHSCNARDRQPRSYHMLFLDAAWCVESMRAFDDRSVASLDSVNVIRDSDLFARYLELVANLANLCSREHVSQIQRLLNDVLSRGRHVSAPLPSSRLAQRIKEVLLENVESPPTLDDLARSFGCRKETLIRAFRRQFHTTPHAFLNNARIEKAKQRLKAGEKIANVAVDLGFCDQAQLHRTFVGYTASTPGQYSSARAKSRVNIRQ